ncbi:hypothetical protein ACA910_019890 [Epithemia clementina (nom. ined.)]
MVSSAGRPTTTTEQSGRRRKQMAASLQTDTSIDLSMPLASSLSHHHQHERQEGSPVMATQKTTTSPAPPIRPRQASRVGSPWKAATDNGSYSHEQRQSRPNSMQRAMSVLHHQGFPRGLARELLEAKIAHPIRFWVIDNSGSMLKPDGHALRSLNGRQDGNASLVDSDNNAITTVPCTRWAELKGAVTYHAELASVLEATSVFRFLNDPGGRVGPQEFIIAGDGNAQAKQDLAFAKSVLQKATPRGATPLTAHLREFRMRVEAMQDILNSSGQRVVVILATDGIPTNKFGESTEEEQQQFVMNMRALQALPVWVVIRLCTDDREVVDYYNHMDAMLELPLEVIDDFFGEAREIQSVNPWLNYTLPLHRCREMGYHHRIFDLLDERLLNKDELKEFSELLFGQNSLDSFPDIHLDWKGFLSNFSKLVEMEGKHFNPLMQKPMTWIDLKQLDKCYKNYKVGSVGGSSSGGRRGGLFRRSNKC